MDSIKIFAPATVANVACGFDIFGFAVDAPGDEVIVKKRLDNQLVITSITGDEKGSLRMMSQKIQSLFLSFNIYNR